MFRRIFKAYRACFINAYDEYPGITQIVRFCDAVDLSGREFKCPLWAIYKHLQDERSRGDTNR